MNLSGLMAARDRFVGVHQQSPPLAALHHMMETKIPRGRSPPAAALPPPPTKASSIHVARSYQPHHHRLPSSSSTPHRIHNILGRVQPPSLQLSQDVAAGFAAAAAAAAAAGLVVERGGVCPGYSPQPAAADCRTPCHAPATTPFWSSQATVESSVADWNHAVTGAYRICSGVPFSSAVSAHAQ